MIRIMHAGYIQAAREVLPHAQLVIDSFHGAEQYRAAANILRKQELKRLKRELPQASYHHN